MPNGGKNSKGAAAIVITKKRIRKTIRRAQSLPVGSPTPVELLNDLHIAGHSGPEKDTLAGVMELLIDIFSRLNAQEKGMDDLKVTRENALERASSSSATQQLASTTEGTARTELCGDSASHLPTSISLEDLSETCI